MELKRIAMDTSKYVFTLHGVDAEDRVVLRRELRRSQVEAFFAALAPTEVVLPGSQRASALGSRGRAGRRITGGGCCRVATGCG
jgi:transposase